MEKEIDIEKIKFKLNTNILGKYIRYFKEIESTQDYAKEQMDFLEDGTYVITDKQTKGRGTKGRKWFDKGHEGICGSFILKPYCHISKLEGFTIKIAECMTEAIRNLYGIDVDIKFPNDLMLNGKKIAGILTESITNKETVTCIIVGIGVNVNQVEFDDEINGIATSLRAVFGRKFQREDIIAEFFNIFEEYYKTLL